jgi:L-threonylcarbamoyladenylate synthase
MSPLRLSICDPSAFETALRLLQHGELIAVPTDTVYGVAAHGLRPEAVERIFVAKHRPRDKAIPLLLADMAELALVAEEISDAANILAERFWPGPLTLVVRRATAVPDVVTGGGDTVAVRVPDHPLPRRLADALQAPLAVTSANLSGEADPCTANDVERALGNALGLIVDGGRSPGGRPSTVVDTLASPPRIVRAGPITETQIAAALREKGAL